MTSAIDMCWTVQVTRAVNLLDSPGDKCCQLVLDSPGDKCYRHVLDSAGDKCCQSVGQAR